MGRGVSAPTVSLVVRASHASGCPLTTIPFCISSFLPLLLSLTSSSRPSALEPFTFPPCVPACKMGKVTITVDDMSPQITYNGDWTRSRECLL